MRRTISSAALLALALPGCWVDDLRPYAGPPAVELRAGEARLRFDPEDASLTLLQGGATRLRLPKEALALGVLPALSETTNYDPVPLVRPSVLYPAPADLTWLTPLRIEATAHDDASLTLSLLYHGDRRATLRAQAASAGSFALTLLPEEGGAVGVAYYRIAARGDAAEGFYGLGEHFDDVNQRGHVRPMQIELMGNPTEAGYDPVHLPLPFVIGTRGWGMLVDSFYPGVFDVATQEADRVDAIFGTGLASKEGISFHLFAEEKAIDVTRHYHEVTGRPKLPARWALGPWVWRDENEDQAQAEGDLQAMRDLDLPATGYWVDRPYATAVQTFDWAPHQFPAPQQLVDKAHDLGFGFALWHTPVLDEEAPATEGLRQLAEQSGYYPPTTSVKLNPWGKLIDFTNAAAVTWWQGLLASYTAMGVEGYKLDYAEDVVPGLSAGRSVWRFADGSDERTMHARYQLVYHQTYADTLPEESFLLCRHSTIGGQTVASVIWPGDLDATFGKNGEPATDENGDAYVSVGGLPASLIAGLSLGPSGFPFYGADTGGYLHSPPDKELFVRWFEQTALSTVMQIGNSASTVAWEPDAATGYDEEMLGWYRLYTRLHLRLFPYEWSYAKRLLEDGRPIQRPIGLVYPELGEHPNDEYLFGDSLLVAPVVERGARSRPVLLPPGSWIDWWTGEVLPGGGTITADAPLEKLPLYLAAGGIVPMLRPTIATLRPVKDASVDSYATDPGELWARVAPGPASRFELFDGGVITQQRNEGRVLLTSHDGSELRKGVLFELIALGARPLAVTEASSTLAEVASLDALAQAASGWAWSGEAGGTVWIKAGPGDRVIVVR